MQKLSLRYLFFFLNHVVCLFCFLMQKEFVVVTDNVRPSLEASLCVKLLGRSFLIGRSGRLPLPEVVAAFVLLSHAVHQEEDEEDGEEEADDAARDDSCNRGFRI